MRPASEESGLIGRGGGGNTGHKSERSGEDLRIRSYWRYSKGPELDPPAA